MGNGLISLADVKVRKDGEYALNVAIFGVDPVGLTIGEDYNGVVDLELSLPDLVMWAYNLGYEKAKESK